MDRNKIATGAASLVGCVFHSEPCNQRPGEPKMKCFSIVQKPI